MKTNLFSKRVLWLLLPLLTMFNFNVWGVTYNKVTDASTLASGDEIIFVNEAANVALSTTQNGNNRGSVSVTISSSTITDPSASVQVITLGVTNKHWTFYTGSDGYLYAASSSKNYLRTQTTNNANGEWTIAISSGNATITAQGSNTHNILKYNSSDGIFSAYASGQQVVQIYKKASSCDKNVGVSTAASTNGSLF